MAGLDTNVLVRWLVGDDGHQSKQVEALLKSITSRQQPLFVPITVILELEWVLRSRYGFGKSSVLFALNALLDTRELEFQSESAIEKAMHTFRQSNADFADCLHAALCSDARRSPLLTFDAKAARVADVRLVSG